jgi:hypothetical protein
MFRRTGGGVIEVRVEPNPVTEPYMQSAEGPAPPPEVTSRGGRDKAGDCGRDSGLQVQQQGSYNWKICLIFEVMGTN